jgi:hypothetical protein
MLVVGPSSGIVPATLWVRALTTSTLLLEESKTSRIDRSGDNDMSPGEPPALISGARTSVSYSPFISSKPGDAEAFSTLCEARTRVVIVAGPDDP